jgi:hypothetical protein
MDKKVDKSLLMRSFNTHFIEFIKDISIIFPENTDIKNGLTSFEMIKRLNPSIIVKIWYSRVYSPYEAVIMKGDLSFFYEKNYIDDLDKLGNAVDIMQIIDKLREPIKDMNEANKEHTMKYIQNLSRLSVMYSTA